MRAFAIALSGAALLVLAVGCRPELAEVELGDTEMQWNHIVRESYPGFRPPRTAPPAIKDKNTPLQDVVPESALPQAQDPFVGTAALNEAAEDPTDAPQVIEVEVVEEAIVPTAATEEPVISASEVKYVDYVVQPGDSLSRIAQKFYKDGRLYERIYEANKAVIKNPNQLPLGLKIRIPQL